MKDNTDYTGVESEVWKKYNEDDISWLPMHKSIVLQHLDQAEEEEGD